MDKKEKKTKTAFKHEGAHLQEKPWTASATAGRAPVRTRNTKEAEKKKYT